MEVLKRLEEKAKALEEYSLELRGEASYWGVGRLVQLNHPGPLGFGDHDPFCPGHASEGLP